MSTTDLEGIQHAIAHWVKTCFGKEIAMDKMERNHRFLEEALELVQSCGCTKNEALQLVDYVYGRPAGEPSQEVGGAFTTLSALCTANDLSLNDCASAELARVWVLIDKIRAKREAKPKFSPLPQ